MASQHPTHMGQLVETIVWNRGSTHNVDTVRLYPTKEYVFHCCKLGHRRRFNPLCATWTKIWCIIFRETAKNPHPARFPEELPYRCIARCAVPEGGIVLDPYMGSGTTAVAAPLHGLHYVGCDISTEYIGVANNRIRLAQIERQMEQQCR